MVARAVAVIMVVMHVPMVVAMVMRPATGMGRRIDHAQRSILGHQNVTGMKMGAGWQLNLQRLSLFIRDLQLMLVALRFVQLENSGPLEQGRCQALAAGQAFGDEEGGQRHVVRVHLDRNAGELLQIDRALQCSELARSPPAKP